MTGSAGDGGPHPHPAPSALIPAPRTEALPADTEAAETALDEEDPDEDAVDEAKGEAPRGAALTEREREILAFERRWWKHAGAKEQAIRDTFDLSATRYYQLLNALLDNPAALAAEPMLVSRLRRLRSSRARSRRR
ncbi:DUF3263 domain-containing protein [Micromonospora sp. NPDC049559]|uniref:DUF3263 domain-containing protein n=1 Tax=Micromonospora sp. NPDC049559 TaxID=3155923 RepID=UPI00341F97C3